MPVIYTLLLISSVPSEKVTILKCVQERCTAPCVRFEPKQETQEDKGTLKTHFMFFLVSNEEFPLFFTGPDQTGPSFSNSTTPSMMH